MKQIGFIDTIDASEITEIDFARPLILKGAAAAWPAIEKWDIDYLLKNLGNQMISCSVSQSNVHPDFTDRGIKKEDDSKNISLQNYLENVSKPNSYHYLFSDQIFSLVEGYRNPIFEPILQDIHIPSFIDKKRVDSAGIWISGLGVRSWLHYDGNELKNLNAQVKGAKSVYLLHPDQEDKLYLFPRGHNSPFHSSQVNIQAPDLKMFPRFLQAEYFFGRLEEGDVLYMPEKWFHTFTHEMNLNININFFVEN